MLNIYIRGGTKPSENLQIINDVEGEFLSTTISGTELDKKLISVVEKGKYVDSTGFIDRNGKFLYYDDMSTGCKAALLVANFPNKVINMCECGTNAVDAIVAFCTSGNILMICPDVKIGIPDDTEISNTSGEVPISVQIEGNYIRNTGDLDTFMKIGLTYQPLKVGEI